MYLTRGVHSVWVPLGLIQCPLGNYDLLANTGHDFLCENKGAVMQLDGDPDIRGGNRHIDHTADTGTDFASPLDIPQVLAWLQVTGR